MLSCFDFGVSFFLRYHNIIFNDIVLDKSYDGTALLKMVYHIVAFFVISLLDVSV